MKINCTRCGEEFQKNNNPHSSIRKIVNMSVRAVYGNGTVISSYYLCPKCAKSFDYWAKKYLNKKQNNA